MSSPFTSFWEKLNRNTGITILLVSHDLSVVSRLADQVFCLENGVITCHGSPQQVLTSEVLAKTFGAGTMVYHHDQHHCHLPRPKAGEESRYAARLRL